MMEEICVALGPTQVSCLTGVPETQAVSPRLAPIRVYRRPGAFAGNELIKALTLVWSFLEIAFRDRPWVIQLSTCSEGYLGLLLQRWFNLPFVIYAHGNEVLTAIDSSW